VHGRQFAQRQHRVEVVGDHGEVLAAGQERHDRLTGRPRVEEHHHPVLDEFRGPLPQAPLIPAGGVTADNVKKWFDAGVVAVGVGSFVTKAARADGNYRSVTEAAATMLRAIEGARA